MPSFGEIWSHFNIIARDSSKKHVSCNYCANEYKYGNAPRMRVHIMKCRQCPDEIKDKFKEQQREVKREQRQVKREPSERTPIRASLHEASSNNDAGIDETVASTGSLLNLDESYINMTDPLNNIINIDEKLVRAMYSSGVSLSMLETKYWKDALNAANIHIPSRHCISNPLLDAEFNRVRAGINNLLDNSRALALIINGWTNVNRKPVLNFILTTPQPVFLKSVYPDPDTQSCTGEYLGQQIIKVIEEIGSTKLVAVITDNEASMKDAWTFVKNKYPHISCVGCVSDTLKLLLKDIMKIRTCKQIHGKTVKIIKRIIHKATILAKFEKIQMDKYGIIQCTLKLPTKCNGEVICLDSVRVNKEALQTLAITKVLDIEIREILLDESFWNDLDDIVSMLQPISDAIKQSELDSATLSDVPAIFSNLEISTRHVFKTIVSLTNGDKYIIKQAINNRKKCCIEPIHLAANFLDPRYRGEHLGTSVPAALEFIGEYARYIYNDNEDKIEEVISNALQFKVKSGYYGQTTYMWKNKLGTPSEWWEAFAPQETLAPIAIRLLRVPPSSAACERNMSLFSNTHTDKRNRMDKKRLEKLIYIRANLRLMDDPRADVLNEDFNSADDVLGNSNTSVGDEETMNQVMSSDEDSLDYANNFGLSEVLTKDEKVFK